MPEKLNYKSKTISFAANPKNIWMYEQHAT